MSRVKGSSRGGMTVLELLVAISIVAILAALLLPAVGAARESSRRFQCVDRMRECGLSLHCHENLFSRFPSGWMLNHSISASVPVTPDCSATGWAVSVIPFLEQSSLAESIDRTRSILDPANALARSTGLPALLCPSDITQPSFVLYEEDESHATFESHARNARESSSSDAVVLAHAVSHDAASGETAIVELPTANFIGVFGTIEVDIEIPTPEGDGAFVESHCRRLREFERGLSNTLLVGERTMAQVPSTWFGVSLAGEDAMARLVGSALQGINNPVADECDFSSRHAGGANFLWADGHVRFVSQSIDLREYHEIARIRLR